jgi:transcriptional regulator with XRE-family HTH domain
VVPAGRSGHDAARVTSFDLPGLLRRIRRTADASQRELADRLAVSKSAIAAAESGAGGLDARDLARAAEVAQLRLTVVDVDGREVTGMAGGAVRDQGGRRFPAHLDTRYGDEDWWHGDERYSREQPWYTFDRLRYTRDHWRDRLGTPADHQLPQPGDSPAERRAARRREVERRARRRQEEELARRRAGELPERPEWTCTCPPLCAELDTGERPRHAPDCPCGCDVG